MCVCSQGGNKIQEAYYILAELQDKFGPSPVVSNGIAVCYLLQGKHADVDRVLSEALTQVHCVHVHICMYVYAFIYMYIYVCVCMHLCVRCIYSSYVYICVCVSVCAGVVDRVLSEALTQICTCVCAHIHVHVLVCV